MSNAPAIIAEGLHKYYGKTHALDGLDLVAEDRDILAVLGPNGSGKTTAVRILTTLLLPDSGRAEVAGFDVLKQPNMVRKQIGLTGQYAAVDEALTGYENLDMFGHLYHLSGTDAKRRANELLEDLDLAEDASRLVRTYSGGMRRRLDLAASLILSPPILFLDEPTAGLDPRGRLTVWEIIRKLVSEGTTVFLTTQYMDEADQLAHHIAVIDHGRVIAQGNAGELKAKIGGERLELTTDPLKLEVALQLLRPYSSGEIQIDSERRHLGVPLTHGAQKLAAIMRDLDAAGVAPDNLALHGPTLDDVFLSLTGRPASETDKPEESLSRESSR